MKAANKKGFLPLCKFRILAAHWCAWFVVDGFCFAREKDFLSGFKPLFKGAEQRVSVNHKTLCS